MFCDESGQGVLNGLHENVEGDCIRKVGRSRSSQDRGVVKQLYGLTNELSHIRVQGQDNLGECFLIDFANLLLEPFSYFLFRLQIFHRRNQRDGLVDALPVRGPVRLSV